MGPDLHSGGCLSPSVVWKARNDAQIVSIAAQDQDLALGGEDTCQGGDVHLVGHEHDGPAQVGRGNPCPQRPGVFLLQLRGLKKGIQHGQFDDGTDREIT